MAGRTRTYGIAVGALIVAALVGVGALVMFGGGGQADDAPPATTLALPDEPSPPDPTEPIEVDEPVPAGEPAELAAVECPFDPGGYEVGCGVLSVPEDRSDPGSPTIELAIAVVYTDGEPAGPPVVYLAGGPGGSAIDDFVVDPEGWDYPFLEGRDLVLLDQRGTGYSEPSLDCPEITDGTDPAMDRACFDRLVEWGIDLEAYNTRENAADVEALRLALGVPEWDLLGISYGTRLALEVMQFHPDGLGAVVLDSPFPPNADTPLDDVYGMTDALTELFADCERDEYCSDNYPDLEAVFLETVDRLNFDETAEIYGDDLVAALRSGFTTGGDAVSLMPWVIYEVAAGNYAALDEIDGGEGFRRPRDDGQDRSDSEGMYYSVMCHDEYTLGDYGRVEAAIVGTVPVELEGAFLQDTFTVTETCSYWNPQDAVDNTAVVGDVPTLVLVGQYDVATPPRWAELTVATLSNAYLFEFPGAGHSVLSGETCAIDITTAFLADPYAVPDAACLADYEWPWFE